MTHKNKFYGATQKIRKMKISREEAFCKICGYRGGLLEIHHLVPKSIKKSIKEKGDKIILCAKCHSRLHKNYTNLQLAKQYLDRKRLGNYLIKDVKK